MNNAFILSKNTGLQKNLNTVKQIKHLVKKEKVFKYIIEAGTRLNCLLHIINYIMADSPMH